MKSEPSRELRPPHRLATLLEFRAPLDALTLAMRWPSLVSAPKGDGRPVLLLPGLGASPRSMWPLKQYLRRLGYDAQDWALGRNRGRVEWMVSKMADQVESLAESRDSVTLIGWSLGGVVARELARLHPEDVREVITFGTPVMGGPKYTAMAERFAEGGSQDLDRFERAVHERNLIGFDQPITSIYSKLDGVVGWRASIDHYNPQARNIEVIGAHLGLGINASVWRIIADTLAKS